MEIWIKNGDGEEWVRADSPSSPEVIQPRRVFKIWVKPNYVMILLFLAAVPCAGYLLEQPTEKVEVVPKESSSEINEETVEVIVDSIFRSIETEKKVLSKELAEKRSVSRFKEWMHYLKAREGFIPRPYRCPANYLTIGYGHNIDAHGWKKVNKYMRDGKLSYRDATALLYDDVKEEIEKVTRMAPHLTRNQALAVASLFANCGSYKITGPKGRPTPFWSAIMKHKTPNFSVYCRYRSKGRVLTSLNLVAARSFEQSLFEGCTKPVKILVGKELVTVSFDKAAQHYQGAVVMRDIIPSKSRNNF
jgi:GH24 family phage-related lysozyme (muramidase)